MGPVGFCHNTPCGRCQSTVGTGTREFFLFSASLHRWRFLVSPGRWRRKPNYSPPPMFFFKIRFVFSPFFVLALGYGLSHLPVFFATHLRSRILRFEGKVPIMKLNKRNVYGFIVGQVVPWLTNVVHSGVSGGWDEWSPGAPPKVGHHPTNLCPRHPPPVGFCAPANTPVPTFSCSATQVKICSPLWPQKNSPGAHFRSTPTNLPFFFHVGPVLHHPICPPSRFPPPAWMADGGPHQPQNNHTMARGNTPKDDFPLSSLISPLHLPPSFPLYSSSLGFLDKNPPFSPF